jgi:pilus assembly protein CpaB
MNQATVTLVAWCLLVAGASYVRTARSTSSTPSRSVPIPAKVEALPPTITPGMRAMSLKVNEVIGVAGVIVPGTRVDVLVTIRQTDESRTRVAVANVQVLTAGTRDNQTLVTLLVTPEDSERIALAQTDGQLMLSLRKPMEQEEPAVRPVLMTDLLIESSEGRDGNTQ